MNLLGLSIIVFAILVLGLVSKQSFKRLNRFKSIIVNLCLENEKYVPNPRPEDQMLLTDTQID